ncbi:MAG: pilus assembly protein FlpE [Jatrophihabitans sp.]|uniref:pilus assembly protein FlpE n=1 Tax=Jatrophihabitans sp. TaxID=1932789 RepID=UPI00390F2BF4
MGQVLAVVGGSGGVGASSFAAVLAAVIGPSVLVDLDVAGGGIDVALGIETVPGARWSGLHVAGGHLDPAALVDGLPRWGPVAVLAADVAVLDPEAVLQVVAAARAVGPVVLDLPRSGGAERAAAFLHSDLVVLLARGDVRGLVAANAVAAALPELPAGVVVRRGEVDAGQAAQIVGCPLLGALPALRSSPFELDPGRLPRAAARVATGLLRGTAPIGADR